MWPFMLAVLDHPVLGHRFSKRGPQQIDVWKPVKWQKIQEIKSDEQFENMSAVAIIHNLYFG